MKNDFFDDLKMTETFAAFCGDGLSSLLRWNQMKLIKVAKTLKIIEQPILDHFVRMSDSKSVKKIIRPFVFSQRNIVE